MSAPRLNRAVWLQQPTATPDGAGGYNTGWTEMGMLWCAIKHGSGRVSTGDGGAVSKMAHRFIVRASPVGTSSRPMPGQRFVDETGHFTITAVAEHDPMGRFLICFTEKEIAV
ncbi:head-tail adaptor protein [Nereida sp. MMG025]|uniref:head-tail adaptor protein n=1 Tax=Nereida sp. MMG025 TaxID=2909981 RepID=UPI001F2FEC8A|nr:head-tail adaptor protein [Nereida sp. MMG025]MCF6443488.1 head-tail adaptor protein [Nereida sp. MMG025]